MSDGNKERGRSTTRYEREHYGEYNRSHSRRDYIRPRSPRPPPEYHRSRSPSSNSSFSCDESKICFYCGDGIRRDQLTRHRGLNYHIKCFDFEKQEPIGKKALRQFLVHCKGPAELLAVHVNYVFGVDTRNLTQEAVRKLKDAKRKKREAKLKELLQYVSAFRNTVSGTIIIHLVGFDPQDNNTGALDEFIDGRLSDLLWAEQFDAVYKKYRLNTHSKLNEFGEYMALYVAKSKYVTTVDYKTKIATDVSLQEANQPFLQEFLSDKKEFKEEFPDLSRFCFTNDISQNLTENREIQFKSRIKERTLTGDIVEDIRSLRLTEYISAHSKLKRGGSFFYGVNERVQFVPYITRVPVVQSLKIDNRESLKKSLLKLIRDNVLVCDYHGNESKEDIVNVNFVPERENRCKCVVVISSRPVRGLVFYGKSGPLAYWYKSGTESVCLLTLKEWFFAIAKKKDESFKDSIKTIVSSPDERIQSITNRLLAILEGDSIFNTQNLVDPAVPLQKLASKAGLLLVCDSLIVPLDIAGTVRPKTVLCDVHILLPHQPMVILTIVEGAVGDEATAYNTGCAGGVTQALSRYLDVNIEVLYGCTSASVLSEQLAVDSFIKDIARDCSLFVTKDSLVMNDSRYKMCLEAFLNKISEAKVLSQMDGHFQERTLRFLTEPQFDIFVTNFDKPKVEIKFEPGSGAKTLMVEVALRLNRINPTLVVCGSLEEREKLRSQHHFVKTSDELGTSDLLKFFCIIDDTGSLFVRSKGRLWTFTKENQSSKEKLDQLKTIKKQLERHRGLLCILALDEEREGLKYLLQELDTLDVLKTNLKEFLMKYQQLELVSESLEEKDIDDPESETTSDAHRMNFPERLNEALAGQRELFPLLGKSWRRIKEKKSYLTSKISYMEDVVKEKEQKTSITEDVNQEASTEKQIQREISEEVLSPPIQKDEDSSISMKKEKTIEDESIEIENVSPSTEKIARDIEKEVSKQTSKEKHIQREISEEEFRGEDEIVEKLSHLKEMFETTRKKLESSDKQMDDLLPLELSIDSVTEKLAASQLTTFVTKATGFQFLHSMGAATKSFSKGRTDQRCKYKTSLNLSRHFQHGELKQHDLTQMMNEFIRADNDEFLNLQRESDLLEEKTGYPIHIVGTVDSVKSSYISCPNMELDKQRVNPWLTVFGDTPVKLKVGDKPIKDRNSAEFKFYEGTCSKPIQHKPKHLTIPRYWEAHVRLRVTGRVTVWEPLFEIALCQESQLDIQPLLSNNKYQPHSWSVTVADCFTHRPGVCTRVFRYGQRVRKCWDNTLEHLPGSTTELRFGVVLDLVAGRLAFLDLRKGFVLQRFDETFTDVLYPMFGIDPDKDDCQVEIELVSGTRVHMTDSKRDLIQRALFSQ